MKNSTLARPTNYKDPYSDLPTITLKGREYRVFRHDGVEASEGIEAKRATYYILLDEFDEQVYYQTPFGKALDNEMVIRKMGFGAAVDEYTFEKYQTLQKFQVKVKEQAMDFVRNETGWFTILGIAGCGKSHIATAVAVELMRKGKSLVYMKWMDSINDIKYNMDRNAKFIKECTRCDVLYIDDFLKTRSNTEPTDIEIELAFQILDKRYTQKKMTIISSEKTIELIKSYDRAVYRRIIEMCGPNLVNLGNDEKRNVSEHGIDGKMRIK